MAQSRALRIDQLEAARTRREVHVQTSCCGEAGGGQLQSGLRIQPNVGSGVFTPATLELDSVTLSTAEGLNVDFSTRPGGFELVDPESATLSHVPG